MQHLENTTDDQTTKQKNQQLVQQPAAGPDAQGKTMLLFGGLIAACCLLPLVLASGLSLAWLTDSPAVGAGILAVLGLVVWRMSRKKASCCNDKQPSTKPDTAGNAS